MTWFYLNRRYASTRLLFVQLDTRLSIPPPPPLTYLSVVLVRDFRILNPQTFAGVVCVEPVLVHERRDRGHEGLGFAVQEFFHEPFVFRDGAAHHLPIRFQ